MPRNVAMDVASMQAQARYWQAVADRGRNDAKGKGKAYHNHGSGQGRGGGKGRGNAQKDRGRGRGAANLTPFNPGKRERSARRHDQA